MPVTVTEAAVKDFSDRIEALGTLAANESVDVTATVTEVVESLHFQDGQRVTKGAVLARLAATEEEALLVEARATVVEAEKQYERAKQLAVGGAAAAAQLDEARRIRDTARARMVAIESRLAELVITAPFDGVVGLRNISAGALVRPGDVIATLDDDSVMKLDFTVPAVFLAVLKPGLPITAKTAAFASKTFEGEIRSIASRVDPVTRSVTVRAEVPNPERLLRPGLLMTVELRGSARQSVVLPEAALLRQGRAVFVMVLEEKEGALTARRREVETGGRAAGEVEILKGLAPGEKVVVDGGFRLTDGAAVRIVSSRPGGEPSPR